MQLNVIRMGAIAAVIVLLLGIQLPRPQADSAWLRTLFEAMHVPVFGLIAIAIVIATSTATPLRRRLYVAGIGTFVIGVFSELIQIPTTRDASVHDLLANWIGGAGCLCLVAAFAGRSGLSHLQRLACSVTGTLLLLAGLGPIIEISLAYLERDRQLPVLFSFEWKFSDYFVTRQGASIGRPNPEFEHRCRDITFEKGPWPGLIFHDLAPEWVAYQALAIDIANPTSESLQIYIRVHDQEHESGNQAYADRYNSGELLRSGFHTLRIRLSDIQKGPSGRTLNLAKVKGVVIFGNADDAGRIVCLGDVRLE